MVEVFLDGRKFFVTGGGLVLRENGKLANCKTSNGYERVHSFGKEYAVHRIVAHAFLGLDLSSRNHVDHINGIRNDNRVENLRVVKPGDNSKAHVSKKANATSKYKGVYWNTHAKQWAAQFYKRGKRILVGYFKDEKRAAKAVNQAYIENGFFPEHLNVV